MAKDARYALIDVFWVQETGVTVDLSATLRILS
jgi:hypothetical protein